MHGDIEHLQANRIQYYDFISDYIDTILWKNKQTVPEKPSRKNPCVIHFSNKGFNKLGLPKIFNQDDVKFSLPIKMQTIELLPYPTYKLDNPIRNKIFNYKETVTNLDIKIEDEISFIPDMPSCKCSESIFCDPYHGHVVTGDLRVIENAKLRKLLSKGPNYREPKTVNFTHCRKSLVDGIDESIVKFQSKYKLGENELISWKDTILKKVDEKIKELKGKIVPQQTYLVLQDKSVLDYLSSFHKQFVIAPIDKASKNVAMICKRFYITKILDELGIPGNRSPTYLLSHLNRDSLIETNNMLCKKFLNRELLESQKSLPVIYWMPKMHYTPSRQRFIIASSTCSTKPLSKLASKIFKHIFNQIRNFHQKSFFYKNYNLFWVIENSAPFIDKILAINRRKAAKDISTFDFSTLYTKLPHDDLVQVLNHLVDFVFDYKIVNTETEKKKYLTVSEFSVYWSKKKHGKMSFSKQDIKFLISHLIRECHFECGNLVFVQKVGIPMGIDPAPFWANLYLYWYEKKYISSLIKSDTKKVQKFRYASRFIDDEGNLNDGGEFGRSCHLIYPSELELKCEHQGTEATFLELHIKVVDGTFVYKLFDKRDNFPFSIVRMPDLHGNIPNHIFYGSTMAEILRIARATLLYSDFIPRIQNIYTRMLNQGGSKGKVCAQIHKAVHKHPIAFTKFGKSANEIISDL
jgi:hypothetical protein